VFYSPFTDIKQPLKQMGQLATKILLEHIEKRLPISEANLEPEFIIRNSISADKN
jgi:LacI family transcriptional regulator